jgi:signal peptidase II
MLFQLAALVFLLDQLTKYVVRAFLPLRDSFPQEGFLRITHTYNTGSAFGLFQGQNTPLILVSVVGIAVLAWVYSSQLRVTGLLRLSLGMQIGGAAGNLLDRLRLGHVTDFIDVGPWPVFNLADSSIVLGLILLAWLFLRPGSAAGRHRVPEASAVARAAPGVVPAVPAPPPEDKPG